ncbi:transcription elongation factor GreA [Candidatus Saccharibacteria bacterium]|nr:transcription elongation factor GreA [Candidatus Saccharibacteria bacterium]
MQKFYLTKAGLEKFERELEGLKKRRPEIAEAIASAREQGDLSENSEYQTAKEEQEILESRIDELESILKNVSIIDGSSRHSKTAVALGSTIHLKEAAGGGELVFKLVGTMEADPFENIISDESPIGQALLGKKVGDKVALPRPSGPLDCEITAIK